jgi:hypothetical protein
MRPIRLLVPLCLAAFAGFSTSCCSECDTPPVEVALCDCGMEKGSEGCCAPDAERCSDCGKIKGSPGCCK